ncbi:MAG: hypothetical protein H6550_16100 [Chitinophagales bacterium]|nr:hypothetical protein [Chitinophagales bacterium]
MADNIKIPNWVYESYMNALQRAYDFKLPNKQLPTGERTNRVGYDLANGISFCYVDTLWLRIVTFFLLMYVYSKTDIACIHRPVVVSKSHSFTIATSQPGYIYLCRFGYYTKLITDPHKELSAHYIRFEIEP